MPPFVSMPGFAVGEDVDKLHVLVLLDGVGKNDEAGQIMGVETVAVDVLEMADDVLGMAEEEGWTLVFKKTADDVRKLFS